MNEEGSISVGYSLVMNRILVLTFLIGGPLLLFVPRYFLSGDILGSVLLTAAYMAFLILAQFISPFGIITHRMKNGEVSITRGFIFIRAGGDYMYLKSDSIQVLRLDGMLLQLKGKGLRWRAERLVIQCRKSSDADRLISGVGEFGSLASTR